MDIRTFRDKYDNGAGWRGCDGGVNWNGVGDNEIWEPEVERVEGGYATLEADFLQLVNDNPDDAKTAAYYFDNTVARKLFTSIDPRYLDFAEKYDNGEGIGCTEDDDVYGLKEVTSAGTLFDFQEEMLALDPAAQLGVQGRFDADVVLGNSFDMFWSTYDNGRNSSSSEKGNGVITPKEVDAVPGEWEKFVDLLVSKTATSEFAKAESYKILDSMTGLPGERSFNRLREYFVEYTSQFNLKQFPMVNASPFTEAREGLNIISKIMEKAPEEITNNSLQPFSHRLAVNANEQIYMDLYRASRALLDKMDIRSLAEIVNNGRGKFPRATVTELRRALVEDPRRYENVSYKMTIKGIALATATLTGEYTTVTVRDIDHNKRLINKLIELKLEATLVARPTNGDMVETVIEFKIPRVRAQFTVTACDNLNNIQDSMTFSYGEEYYLYDVNLQNRTIYKYSVDPAAFMAKYIGGIQMVVRPGLNGFLGWSLTPSSDVVYISNVERGLIFNG